MPQNTQPAPATTGQTHMHTPRPALPETLSDRLEMLHYGSSAPLKIQNSAGFRVMRSPESDCAIVTLTSPDYWSANCRATPAELREMAARLIDAAADIEAHAPKAGA